MPYIAWNDGASYRWFDPSENHKLQPGEVEMGLEAPTPDELRAQFPNYDAAIAKLHEVPKPTKEELLAQVQALTAQVEAL